MKTEFPFWLKNEVEGSSSGFLNFFVTDEATSEFRRNFKFRNFKSAAEQQIKHSRKKVGDMSKMIFIFEWAQTWL